MASIERYTTGGGTRYSVRYRTPAGSQTKKRGFRTKKEAELFLAHTEVRKATGDYVAPQLGRATVGDLAPAWLQRKEQIVGPGSYVEYECCLRVHVLPRWGSVPVSKIDLLGVETWISVMGRDGVGATTVRKAHMVLAQILREAVKGKRIPSNPARGVDNLPSPSPKKHVYLTEDDVYRLADAAGEHGTLILTLAFCGLRWGEATALQIRDVEFLRRRLAVSRNQYRIGGKIHEGLPKGSKPRSVPVPQFVLDALSVQCAGRAPDELVFPGRSGVNGGFLTPALRLQGWFRDALKAAGISDPTITPHSLRHTCASLSASAGVKIMALSRMLGHTKASMTLDVYSDLFDTDLDAAADAIHDHYSRPERSVPKVCPRPLNVVT